MKRKMLSVLLTFSIFAAFVPCVATAEDEKYGEWLHYEVNENGDGVTITYCDKNATGEIEIPAKIENLPVTTIAVKSFLRCSYLTKIKIPNTVTKIHDDAFGFCTSLTSVVIPNSVTGIGWYAFENCTSLTDITIPDSVTNIGKDAFYGTKYYENEWNWQNKVLYIDNHLIGAKEEIKDSYTIKDNTKTIAEWAFSGCSLLTSVNLPVGVRNIGNFAFNNCSSLTDVTIPDAITIGENAFSYCTSLTNVSIPDTVTEIGQSAFRNCSSLTNITIPSNVKRINDGTFNNCIALKNIAIPDNITNIGAFAFYECNNLTDVYYSGTEQEWNLIEIGSYNENLTNATIHYGIYDQITPAALTVTPSSSGYALTADTVYDGVAYAAAYDAEGRLLNVVSKPFTGGTATVTPDTTGAAEIKFFVWTNTLQPVTYTETMDLQ